MHARVLAIEAYNMILLYIHVCIFKINVLKKRTGKEFLLPAEQYFMYAKDPFIDLFRALFFWFRFPRDFPTKRVRRYTTRISLVAYCHLDKVETVYPTDIHS